MITDGRPSITTINNFLGLNMNETGETQLKLGEASAMQNFRITKDYKLEKMNGYEQIYNPNNRIRAMWVGNFRGTDMTIYVAGGTAYKDGTSIGTMTDDVTTIFEFGEILYFINGHEFKYYTGVYFGDVGGYEPTIKISCTPAGVGQDYEPINLISPFRKVSFSADGVAQTFQLPEKDITMYTGNVWVDGVAVSSTVTYNSENGTVTLETPPAQGTDNVVIRYKKNNIESALAENITKNKYVQKYGLADDTRVFLYGNPDAKNRVYFSETNAENKPEYFPATNFIDVGSSNTAVTDISRQYDRLIISKEEETYYSMYDAITDTSGTTIITFPMYPLNKAHGMIAKAQGQVLDNYVTTLDSYGIVQWVNTQSKDERNAKIVSERVNEWLQSHDLTKAVTMDYQEQKEYWVGIDNEVLVYNYENSTFFLLNLPDNVRALTTFKGTIYLGTDKAVMRFKKELTTYNGAIIDAEWQGGFYDFEAEYKRKTMRILWITVKPQEKTYMAVNYITDRNVGMNEREISSQTFAYQFWNYADFTYNANIQVKPYKIKLKAKKFAFLKLIIKSDKQDYKLIVDTISIQKAYGGFVK
jgi:hypothetical protein